MKSKIKTIGIATFTAAALGVGGLALADRGGHGYGGMDSFAGMERGDHHGKHKSGGKERGMLHRLDLDDAQRVQIEGIQETFEPQFEALRERMQANREAMRALRQAETFDSAQLAVVADERGTLIAEGIKLRASMQQQVQAVLTDEQREQMRKRGRRHG